MVLIGLELWVLIGFLYAYVILCFYDFNFVFLFMGFCFLCCFSCLDSESSHHRPFFSFVLFSLSVIVNLVPFFFFFLVDFCVYNEKRKRIL